MSECPRCLEQFENDDECLQSDHGLCWPCASAKLDDVLDDARAQRIRDIVAQQWAVAIAIIGCTLTKSDGTPTDPDDHLANVWAKCLTTVQGQIVEWLPSAAEIVGGEP